MKSVTNMPKAVKSAISTLLSAKATWKSTNDIDFNSRLWVLSNNSFCEEDSSKRILEPRSDFLMNESDFEKYCRAVYAKNCESGIDSGDWNTTFWPLQKAVYDAEDVLIDAISADIPEYTPEIVKSLKSSPDKKKKFLEILGL